jgi:hypothetical protein
LADEYVKARYQDDVRLPHVPFCPASIRSVLEAKNLVQ